MSLSSSLPLTSKASQMQDRLFLVDPIGAQMHINRQPMTNLAIVLDLDETLVHSSSDMNEFRDLNLSQHPDLNSRTYRLRINDVITPHGQGKISEMWGIKRPHINEFLAFCFSYFKVVIIWSAGTYKYVHAVVDNIFADIVPPHIVYTRDDCHQIDGICDKNLSKLFQNEELKGYVTPENTLLIDDREYSFGYSHPESGVLIPEFKPNSRVESLRTDDVALLQLRAWFMTQQVKNSPDVRQLNTDQIFKISLRQYSQILTSPLSPHYRLNGLAPLLRSKNSTIEPVSRQELGDNKINYSKNNRIQSAMPTNYQNFDNQNQIIRVIS